MNANFDGVTIIFTFLHGNNRLTNVAVSLFKNAFQIGSGERLGFGDRIAHENVRYH